MLERQKGREKHRCEKHWAGEVPSPWAGEGPVYRAIWPGSAPVSCLQPLTPGPLASAFQPQVLVSTFCVPLAHQPPGSRPRVRDRPSWWTWGGWPWLGMAGTPAGFFLQGLLWPLEPLKSCLRCCPPACLSQRAAALHWAWGCWMDCLRWIRQPSHVPPLLLHQAPGLHPLSFACSTNPGRWQVESQASRYLRTEH